MLRFSYNRSLTVDHPYCAYISVCVYFCIMAVCKYASKTRVLKMESNSYYGKGKIKLNCYMLL